MKKFSEKLMNCLNEVSEVMWNIKILTLDDGDTKVCIDEGKDEIVFSYVPETDYISKPTPRGLLNYLKNEHLNEYVVFNKQKNIIEIQYPEDPKDDENENIIKTEYVEVPYYFNKIKNILDKYID